MKEIIHLIPLLPFLLGFLTQEQLAAKEASRKIKQKVIFRLILFGLLGISLFFIFNKKHKKPWEQPDHRNEKPEYAHLTKPEKPDYYWDLHIVDGQIVAKVGNPGGPGENFNNEDHWRQRLEQLVHYVVMLRQSRVLYEPEHIIEINGFILKEVFAICSKFGIALHPILQRMFGKDYVVHVVFLQTSPYYIDTVVCLYPPGTTLPEIIDSFYAQAAQLIGCIRIASETGRVFFDEYQVIEKITEIAWNSLVEQIRSFILNDGPTLPGGPINPN